MRTWSNATALLCFAALFAGCSSDDEIAAPDPATGQPTTVTDLAVQAGSDTDLTLSWTTPGVPDDNRPLTAYDLRGTALGTEDQPWDSWDTFPTPDPAAPGQSEQAVLTDLTTGETWVFRLRSRSDTDWSPLSAAVVATVAEQWDQTAPAPIADLELYERRHTEFVARWSITGDDLQYGEASGYEMRFHTEPLDTENWSEATVAPDAAFDATLDRWFSHVTGLDAEDTIHLAVRAVDDVGNWSDVSNLLVSPPPDGTIWHVREDGTGTVPTVAEGVRQARPGDLVLVHPGRYTWTNQDDPMHDLGMIFVGRDTTDFTIASAAGPATTILDAEQQGRVLFVQGYNDGLVIEGFTITGGVSTPYDGETAKAGGLTFHLTSTTIRDCIFEDNSGDEQGGAVYFGGVGNPTFERCVFRNNHAGSCGGGVYAVNVHGESDPETGISFLDCVFTDNTSAFVGGGVCISRGVARFNGCVIAGNQATESGGGVYIYSRAVSADASAWVDLTRCTLASNDAPLGAAVRMTHSNEDPWRGLARLLACIVAHHDAQDWLSVKAGAELDVGCTVLFGNADADTLPATVVQAGEMFAVDPEFCADGSYGLMPTSPCLPENRSGGDDCGVLGARDAGCSGR